jgi:alpha-beta hydrolase superfamily lysophospholipase
LLYLLLYAPTSTRHHFVKPHRVRPKHVKTPMLVLGGEDDGHINQKASRDTARAYNAAPEIFPQMGHNMMLESGWQAVAERIDGWLADQGL